MADVSVLPNWKLVMSNDEFKLILKSLGSRLNAEEAVKANALCDLLTTQRVKNIEDLARNNTKLAVNVAAKLEALDK